MTDINKSFKQLDLIFIAVLSSQIMMAFIFYILRDMNVVDFSLLEFEYLPIIILLANTTAILLAKYFFTARNRIDKKFQLDEKFSRYKSISLIIIVILDFANVINIVIFFFTGSQVYLLVALLAMILYIVYRPSKIKFTDALLMAKEKEELLQEE